VDGGRGNSGGGVGPDIGRIVTKAAGGVYGRGPGLVYR